jgi:hypothetical protein
MPEAVCTVMCSWWWAEEPPETYRASVKINKFKKHCILLGVICNYITMHGHTNMKNNKNREFVLYIVFLYNWTTTIVVGVERETSVCCGASRWKTRTLQIFRKFATRICFLRSRQERKLASLWEIYNLLYRMSRKLCDCILGIANCP